MALALGALALVRLSEANAQLLDISSNWMPAVQSLGEMRAQLGEYRTYEQAQLGKQGDAAAVADYDKRMADTYRQIVDAKKQYDAIDAASSSEETALEQKIEAGLKTYFGAHQRIAAAIAADDFDTARKVSGSDSRIARRDLFDALKQLSSLNAAQLDKNVAASKQAYRRTLALFVIALSALVAVAAALGWIISRAIARPLAEATQAARAIAAGKLDGARLDGGKDEIGDLLRSMQAMRDVLQRFAGESQRMATLHASGEDIRYRMPEDFPGTYNELVAGTNKMVYEHLDAIIDAIGVLNEYAAGDLRRDVPRLPGQRAVLHESMDAAKASLMAMRDAILKLSEAAAQGDFSVREDAGRFQHSFREMVVALNRLMAEAGDGLQDIGRVVSAIATGDLQQRVEKQYPGAFGVLAEDANRTAEQLTGIVGGILHASDTITTAAGEIASGNSDLSRRTEQQAANL
ncbi:MAG: methyl-accepting chemotaxis protein, partial [Sphingomonas hengshuiensis]